ncbi:MAG: hypothetical protein OXT09_32140 [Myxococcales bacterium]|nr:hypothetical protein [Myxococcales bacterium]
MSGRVRVVCLAGLWVGFLGCSSEDGGDMGAATWTGSNTGVAGTAGPTVGPAMPAAGSTTPIGTAAPGDAPDALPPDPGETPVMTPGCTSGDLDSDGDGSLDCDDACPMDALKVEPGACGCGMPEPTDGSMACEPACNDEDCVGDADPGPDASDPDLCAVQPITDELRDIHGEVYTRFASAEGVPVLATDSPQDEALRRACMMVRDLANRPEILQTMLEEDIGLVVMGEDETSADFPEFARWNVPDWRARGLGGVPRGLCAEENIMCNTAVDRWRGESICVHEFAHTMHLGVYNRMDPTFDERVDAAYRAAIGAGKFDNTYAASNAAEYLAEGVQDWYNTNLESSTPNGVHNHINTRAELQEYDPGLYEILAEVLPDQPAYQDCYFYE